jgi:hypothetical protein
MCGLACVFVFISSYVVLRRMRIIDVARRCRAKDALTFLQKKKVDMDVHTCICMIGRAVSVFKSV